MTTKEKIEVMQAYTRGEEIERRSANCEEDEWAFAGLPVWNWEKFKYRIKPKEKRGPKFKIGDMLVHLEKEGQPLYWGDIYRVVSIDEKYTAEEAGYQYKGAYEYFEKIFIKADDVLWYWEYQDEAGDWHILDRRYSREDLNIMLEFRELATATPLYALGFRLLEKIGN
jgi:hypothetical protein|nr:MAG TPA: hypothetical protein [Caudoviricetes sp.]